MSIVVQVFGSREAKAREIILACVQEVWQANKGADRQEVIARLQGSDGFRVPTRGASWKQAKSAVEFSIRRQPVEFLDVVRLAYVGPRRNRTADFYRLLGVTSEVDVDLALEAVEPVPETAQFVAVHSRLEGDQQVEFLIWTLAICFHGLEAWQPSAIASIEEIANLVLTSSSGAASVEPARMGDTEQSSVDERHTGDVDGSPDSFTPPTDVRHRVEALTPLDHVFIDLAVAAVAKQDGSRTLGDVSELAEELNRLNSKRVTSRFHLGYVAALGRIDLPEMSGADNVARRAWTIAGWLRGHCRFEGLEAYKRFEGLSLADSQRLLATPGAMAELADEYIRILGELDRTSELQRWLPFASIHGRAAALAIAQGCLRADRPSEAAAIAGLLLKVGCGPFALLDAMVVEITAARMLRDFGHAEQQISSIRQLMASVRPEVSNVGTQGDDVVAQDLAALERDVRTQALLCKAKIRRVEALWFAANPTDRSVEVTLQGVAMELLAEISEERSEPSATVAYLACLLLLSNTDHRNRYRQTCVNAAARALAGTRNRHSSPFISRIVSRLAVLRALLASQSGTADLIESIATVSDFEKSAEKLPFYAVSSLIEDGLAESVERVADLIVPRLQSELPSLLSSGMLAAALTNPKVCSALASDVAEYLRPLAGPKQVQVRADLFRTIVDANGSKSEVVQMADELIGTVQAYPSSAAAAIDALLARDRWTRVWTEDDFVAIHAELAHGCDELYRSAARSRAMGRARYLSRQDPDAAEECLELADWLGEPVANLATVRLMVDRLAAASRGRAARGKVDSPVRVLFVGGDERQQRLQPKITELVDAKRSNVRLSFEHPGWSSNWGQKLDRVVARLKDVDVVVLLRFTRTMYGERLREAIGRSGKQWRPTYGHGAPSIARAIVAAANEIAT